MRTKVTLVLVFLNVALFFFIFYLKTGLRPIDEKPGILGPEVVNIQALEIAPSNRPDPIRLERRNENWTLIEPVEWPANPFAVTRILTELQQLRSQASFAVKDLAKNGQSLADYGLEKPPLSLTFTPATSGTTDAAEPVTLRIGDTAKVGNRLYVLSPDGERVHVVNRSLAESLAVSLEELRSDTLFSIPVFEVRSLNLQTGAPSNLKVRIARTDSRWQFESPITARANKNETDVTINRLNGLRIERFVDPRTSEPLRLNPEEMTLRVTLEGNNRRETLILGGRVREQPAPPPAASAEDGATEEPTPSDVEYYYGKMDEKAPVFTVGVSASLLERIRAAQETLRDRQILDVDPAAVTGVTLSATGQPDLALQRLEGTTATSSRSNWEIVRRVADRSPQTVPADAEVVARLIANLCQLEALEFETDAPTDTALENFGFNRPARRIRITVATPSATGAAPTSSSVVLLLGIGIDRHVYAKLESPNYVYRVTDEILQQTPVTLLDYRDRLVRDLPAGATIKALTLTDLANDTVLLDATLPLAAPSGSTNTKAPANGGAAATPPPAPTAAAPSSTGAEAAGNTSPEQANAARIEALATQLRTIRAKRFVREEFTKTIPVRGEERPWRYQLTCTLSLVGGNGDQIETFTLFFSERVGGNTQLVGAPELDVVFEAEQPLLDALFALIYGPRDPGPTPPEADTTDTTAPAAAPTPERP